MKYSNTKHCDQIWRNFTILAKLKKIGNLWRVYLVFGKIVSLLWQTFRQIGKLSLLQMAKN